ncbi:MAG TPA: serine hydrolase domain-containing protein [Pseudonocardia sp.]|jgi:CubicO group peptidase (beta-lactamase class C family)|nr:serine hydrolase domain-containing protein [Pseudonocardia sp.]
MTKVDDLLGAAVSSGQVPGLAAMAAGRGRATYSGAFGTRSSANSSGMSEDTVFEVSALLRPVMAVAALQLVDAELLALDEPLRTLLPELAAPRVLLGFDPSGEPVLRPARGEITLRRLLNHTAGFTVGSWWDGAPAQDDLWSLPYRAGSVALLADPGTRWLHCLDTDLIAMVIERISGLTLDEYLRSAIFRELGMLDTGFEVPPRARARTVGGWSEPDDAEGLLSFYSTPRDFFEFLEALLWRDESLLSPLSFDLLRGDQIGGLSVPRRLSLSAARTPGDINLYPEIRLYPDTERTWSLGFMVNLDAVADGPRAGTLSCAGTATTFCWLDPVAEVAGLLFLRPGAPLSGEPFFGEFQRAVYADRPLPGRPRRDTPEHPGDWPSTSPTVWWPL